MTEANTKCSRLNFIRIDQDTYHHYYSFGFPGFEICLEPCAAGFDVAIYADDGELPEFKSVIEPKQCTKTGDYTTSSESLFGDRKDEDWTKALAIADQLLETYFKDGKLGSRELLNREDLITGDEIAALRARAKTITMQDGLRITMQGGFVPVIPMDLKSGFGVSLTIIENPPNSQLEVFSVTYKGRMPDVADADHIALVVLGKYTALDFGHMSKQMLHYWKRRE